MPKISPARTENDDVVERRAERVRARHRQIEHAKARIARRVGAARVVGQRMADHQLRERRAGLLPRIDAARHAAAAHDRRGLAERLDLVELVADVENAAAFRREAAAAP